MRQLKYWFDDVLGRLTMYHVTVQGLVVLCVAAAVLMVTGYLEYSLVAFVVHVVVLVSGAYGANRLLGWLFGVKPHGESAVITGLILALVFSPPVSLIAGVKLLIVAAIAMASKYILVVRGKHVFNPAAIAIVISSVTGFAYASWWVATPALLPLTVLVALLVLYKTQKIIMGLVCIAIALPLVVIQTALAGSLTPQAITAAITSWPLVFFAGVMLSEPQTLPPRRNQQYGIAAMVGVVMTIPLHYGPIIMTPALALVLGNIVAFYFSIRRGMVLRFMSKKRVGADSYEFMFDTKPLLFEPGQYIEVSLPHKGTDFRGSRRVFTIIGTPGSDVVSIATRVPARHPSSFKRALIAMKPRQIVYGTRIAGDFVLPRDQAAPIIFIAGGIGITPLVSFLSVAGSRDVTVLYAVSSRSDVAFAHVLQRYDITVVIVTPDEGKLPVEGWLLEPGRITADLLKKYGVGSPRSVVYISGPPRMVDQTKQWAKALGATQVKTDHFNGY